jgi:hypothetical protein
VFGTPITLGSAQLALFRRLAEASGFFPNARLVLRLDSRQVNEFTDNGNFQSQSVSGLNVTLARRTKA